METVHEEFPNEDGSVTFYYDMECFYFDDTYPEVLNETLQTYYASVEESYLQDSQVYTEPLEENTNIPYDSLIFQYFTYVEEDYVSLVYNNVCYMGGAHPYSAMDEADVIILASPVYVYHSTGAMKAFLDHYGYRWMVHSPEESMFKKQGVCISTAAGAGMKSTNKDMMDSLFFWGVAKRYQYGVNCVDGEFFDRRPYLHSSRYGWT